MNRIRDHFVRCFCFMPVLLFSVGCSAMAAEQSPEKPRIEAQIINEHYFELELAVTPDQRTRGLMGRANIPFEGGMLFVFPRAEIRSFWMANCLADLDIVFLDPAGRITATHTMRMEPSRGVHETQEQYESRLPRYSSIQSAMFAIEFKVGVIALLELKPGDRIPLDVKRLAEAAFPKLE